MARVIAARHGDPREVDRLADAVAAACPGFRVSAGTWDGEHDFAAPAGVRYLWLVDGSADVLLLTGYRTQEGDGEALPPAYVAEALPDVARAHLEALRDALARDAIHPQVRAPVAALCARATDGTYRGDIRGDLWLLLESGVDTHDWAATTPARLALRWFVHHCGELGWSTKQAGGWERLSAGDQLVATPTCAVRVRGWFRFWAIEHTGRTEATCSAVRRLRYLRDTAGGCSPGFDAFRRLNLTWQPTEAARQRVATAVADPESAVPGTWADVDADGGLRDPGPVDPDAPNRLNSHVLHIEAAQSRTHYHPEEPIGGGAAQHEFYFVLDPAAYGLRAPAGAMPRLYTFPDVHDWRQYEVTDLTPGLAAYVPPGTGHRGVDAFVNVVTIPGFKPRNEMYVDRQIREQGAGALFNAAAAGV
ncbi:MAG: hypothetical protein HY332_05865 [Chloroflexi bacterium]|nr:hypothetical protein [Chloroflexota bacterium]